MQPSVNDDYEYIQPDGWVRVRITLNTRKRYPDAPNVWIVGQPYEDSDGYVVLHDDLPRVPVTGDEIFVDGLDTTWVVTKVRIIPGSSYEDVDKLAAWIDVSELTH
jgi:hypothetical protein